MIERENPAAGSSFLGWRDEPWLQLRHSILRANERFPRQELFLTAVPVDVKYEVLYMIELVNVMQFMKHLCKN
jgi:hypothetical protein